MRTLAASHLPGDFAVVVVASDVDSASCGHPRYCPSNDPDELGGSPGSSQSLSTNSQPHDQIQVLLQGSLDPLLSSDGASAESLSLGRSDPSLHSDRLSLGRSELWSLL